MLSMLPTYLLPFIYIEVYLASKPNITKDKAKTLKELRWDNSWIIPITDEGSHGCA